jgi:hypothetical protein
MPRLLKRILVGIAVTVGVLAVMQLVPYGRDHTNPRVVKEPAWDSPQTRELAVRACFDCHSNETKWPWYSNVAPFSWVVQRHVDIGRTVLNFSDWTRTYPLAAQAPSNVLMGEMPIRSYLWAHPESDLTVEEKDRLARGLELTFGLPTRDRQAAR